MAFLCVEDENCQAALRTFFAESLKRASPVDYYLNDTEFGFRPSGNPNVTRFAVNRLRTIKCWRGSFDKLTNGVQLILSESVTLDGFGCKESKTPFKSYTCLEVPLQLGTTILFPKVLASRSKPRAIQFLIGPFPSCHLEIIVSRLLTFLWALFVKCKCRCDELTAETKCCGLLSRVEDKHVALARGSGLLFSDPVVSACETIEYGDSRGSSLIAAYAPLLNLLQLSKEQRCEPTLSCMQHALLFPDCSGETVHIVFDPVEDKAFLQREDTTLEVYPSSGMHACTRASDGLYHRVAMVAILPKDGIFLKDEEKGQDLRLRGMVVLDTAEEGDLKARPCHFERLERVRKRFGDCTLSPVPVFFPDNVDQFPWILVVPPTNDFMDMKDYAKLFLRHLEDPREPAHFQWGTLVHYVYGLHHACARDKQALLKEDDPAKISTALFQVLKKEPKALIYIVVDGLLSLRGGTRIRIPLYGSAFVLQRQTNTSTEYLAPTELPVLEEIKSLYGFTREEKEKDPDVHLMSLLLDDPVNALGALSRRVASRGYGKVRKSSKLQALVSNLAPYAFHASMYSIPCVEQKIEPRVFAESVFDKILRVEHQSHKEVNENDPVVSAATLRWTGTGLCASNTVREQDIINPLPASRVITKVHDSNTLCFWTNKIDTHRESPVTHAEGITPSSPLELPPSLIPINLYKTLADSKIDDSP